METIEKTELSILSEISRVSNSYLDLTRKLQRIIEVIAGGMGKDGASVFLLDRSGKNVSLAAAIGLNQQAVGKLTFPLGMGIAGWVAEQKVPLALEDPFSDPRFQYVPETGIERFKSLVAAPIMDDDRCFGVLFVLSSQAWNATTSDITLLTTTANQISGVIKSAQMFQNIQERLSELSTIHEIGMALTSTLNLDQLVALIAKNSMQALHAQGCTIRLLNVPETRIPACSPIYRIVGDSVRDLEARLGDAITDMTAAGKKPLLIPDIAVDPAFKSIPSLPGGSILSVPLVFHDKVIGVITLYNKHDGLPFNEDDLQFLTTTAARVKTMQSEIAKMNGGEGSKRFWLASLDAIRSTKIKDGAAVDVFKYPFVNCYGDIKLLRK